MSTPLRTTDPDRIRALAHPVRLDLLGLLDDLGEATATQCAERLGETVANCSFHLRTLAAAGFIEPAPRRGRERPWRPTSPGRSLEPDPDDPASRRAVGELAGLTVLREADRVRAFLQTLDAVPPEWDDTVVVRTGGFWATADEMRELVATVSSLTARFEARRDDPSLRPPGARLGRLFATVNPDSFPDEASTGEPPTEHAHIESTRTELAQAEPAPIDDTQTDDGRYPMTALTGVAVLTGTRTITVRLPVVRVVHLCARRPAWDWGGLERRAAAGAARADRAEALRLLARV